MYLMTNTNRATTTLGTIGKRADLSRTYAAGSYVQSATFKMFGLAFRGTRFVRTDGCACDVVEIYQADPTGQDFESHIGYAAHTSALTERPRLMTCPVARRALELLAVGAADAGDEFTQRVANLGW